MNARGAAVAALILAGCASGPSGSDTTLRVWDLAGRAVEATGVWRTQLVSGSGTDWARKIICRRDGACMFFGGTRGSFGPTMDFLAMGEIPEERFQWARTYGGSHEDELDGAAALPDGAVMYGQSASAFGASGLAVPGVPPRPLLVRIDGTGAPLWARTLDAGGMERFHDGVLSGDGIVFAGYAGLRGDTPSVAAARLTLDGALVWAHAFDLGVPGYAVAVAPAAGGGVVLAGYLRLPNVTYAGTPFLLALDAAGRPLWARRYDLEAPAQPRALLAAADGSLVLGGTLFGSTRSPFLLRVGPDGALQLGREFRGLEPIEAMAVDAADGQVILAGRRHDVFINRYFGFAMLVDDRGRITAHATLLSRGTVEFRAASGSREGEYRVAGATNALGAAGLDILVGGWRPTFGIGDASVASRIAERELAVGMSGVTARAQALPVRATEVPPAALEVRTIDVPGAALPAGR